MTLPALPATRRTDLGIFNVAFLFVLATAALLMVEPTARDGVAARIATSLRQAAQPHAASVRTIAPSAFETELAMTPQQLLSRWDPLVEQAAKKFSVPEKWIKAVMRMESGGRTMADESHPLVSAMGAMGLMQVMPRTFAAMRAQYGLGSNPYDARDNIFAGTAYLGLLWHRYGNPAMFAAYNDGPGGLEDHLAQGKPLPKETLAYLSGVTGLIGEHGGGKSVQFTQPDGKRLAIARADITGVRAPLPGEYADGVNAVLSIGKKRQGVRENVAEVKSKAGVL